MLPYNLILHSIGDVLWFMSVQTVPFNHFRSSSTVFRRKQWHPTPVLFPGKSHGQRGLMGCSPWGSQESDTTERLHFIFSLSCIGEGNGNPLQCSCLENPRDGGAWWAAVYGVAQSQTQLKRLSSSSSSHSIQFKCGLKATSYSTNLPLMFNQVVSNYNLYRVSVNVFFHKYFGYCLSFYGLNSWEQNYWAKRGSTFKNLRAIQCYVAAWMGSKIGYMYMYC